MSQKMLLTLLSKNLKMGRSCKDFPKSRAWLFAQFGTCYLQSNDRTK